ncbi:hypothetical protein BDY24DRAFT_373818, partial [Mrakia frigida]|uniref:F-box protein n=1 Tax=Mrakia frigida TaxID=29902 RepID=UPI003FCC0DE6
MALLESSMHSSSDLPEMDEGAGQDGDETDGSYMSSSFYASDQGEDSEDESQAHVPVSLTSPLPPVQVQPANTLPGLPFLALQEVASYLSLKDLASLYQTHRQLRSTIDEGSLSFFGRFWTSPPRVEWVNRARRAHGWHEPVASSSFTAAADEGEEAGGAGEGRRGRGIKMSEVGMDEFWTQIKTAFWVTSFPWDRNDRAMIQQSFWSNLLSPENSPPPEPSPPEFASSSSSSSLSPIPQPQTRLLRPTLSAGYRAYAQHGYVLTGAHHLLLLQKQVCWLCLFCPEEGSQGPEIRILKDDGGKGGRATTGANAEDGGGEVAGLRTGGGTSMKVCEGCGAASCGRL